MMLAILSYQSHPYVESVGLLVQEMKFKIDFHNGRHGGHLGFPIGMMFAIFLSTDHPNNYYQVLSQMTFQFRRKS